MSQTFHSPLRVLAFIGFWLALPLSLGIVLAVLFVPVPRVGVIRFEDTIWSESADSLAELLDHARDDRSIRAVVLEIDSPGGEVTATEEIYFRLLELRQSKPVVVTIDYMAASGGYYLAAAGDYVFAKPASLVGNIGVVRFLPTTDGQRFTDEDYVSTGPFKFSGGSRGDYARQIELAMLSFLEAVFAQRGAKLRADREALASGEIFMGMQALRLGLIDELGANSEALGKAADLAHLANYRVVDVAELIQDNEPPVEEEGGQNRLAESLASGSPVWHVGLHYLYIEPVKRSR